MIGPNLVLVRRTASGYRTISCNEAAVVQRLLFAEENDPDRLYRTRGRIAEALGQNQLSLAQIYGLHLPIDELDNFRLRGLIKIAPAFKAGYNPDEPRIPAGNPQGGEWTTGGGEESGSDAGRDDHSTVPSENGDGGGSGDPGEGEGSEGPETLAPNYGGNDAPRDTQSGSGQPGSSDTGISWQIAPTNGDAEPSTSPPSAPAISYQIAPAGTVAAAAGAASGSRLGPLAAEALASLAEIAGGLSAPALSLGILFFPSGGDQIIEGTVQNSPDLAYRFNRDTGFLQIWQAIGTGNPAPPYDSQIGLENFLYDPKGNAIGRLLPGGAVIVDPDLLPGYQAQGALAVRPAVGAGVEARVVNDSRPKLCPDPSNDRPGGRRGLLYQQYVSLLINGRASGRV